MTERKKRLGLRAVLVLLVAALAVVAAGCGGDDDSSSSSTQIEGLGTTLEEIQAKAKEEGEVNLVNWAGYVEKDWTTRSSPRRGCKVNSKVGASSDEMVTLMQDRELRRRLRVRRRDASPDRGGRRRAGEPRPDPELRERLRRPEEPAAQHRRRRLVRCRARSRRQPAGLEHEGRDPGTDDAGTSSGTRTPRPPGRSRSTTARSTSPMPRCT